MNRSGARPLPYLAAAPSTPVGLHDPDCGRRTILALAQADCVDPAALRALRKTITAEAVLTSAEAEAMFAVERCEKAKCSDWDDFFIEAISDHCIWDLRPTGVVNEAQGEWLIAMADTARTPNVFAVLVNVLFVAHRVPLWFTAAVKARAVQGWPGAAAARAMWGTQRNTKALAAELPAS